MAILRMALETVVSGRSLEPRQVGMLQHAVDSMLARRGRPGSERHTALRNRQADDAAQPAHHAIAQVVVARLASLPQEAGVGSIGPLLGPVTAREEGESGVPARLAADVLEGTLYARYYDIDYRAVRQIDDVAKQRRFSAQTSDTFASLCTARAGGPADRWSVSANGMVIEQSQILTTHTLATLVRPVGVAPAPGWPELARRSFRVVSQLVSGVHDNPGPLGAIKDAAYAWRQTLLYLALTSHEDQAAFVAWAREQVRARPAHTAARLDAVVAGLAHVLAGGTFDADGVAGNARRFLGWAVHGHWMQPRKAEARR